jgi:hypothetical protein
MDEMDTTDHPTGQPVLAGPATQPAGIAALWRRSRAFRVGASAVVACGLAAGSYGIAAASGAAGAARPVSRAVAVSSSPSGSAKSPTPASKTPPSAPRHLGPFGGGFGAPGFWGGGFGRSGFGALGLGGTVTGLTATTITVDTARNGTTTVATDSSTVYSEDGRKVARSVLAAGEEVVFRPASPPAASTSSTPTLVKGVEIVLPHVSGKVMSVNGTQVVVQQADGLDVTVNLSSSTAYDAAGQAATSSAVVAGAEVSVAGTLTSDHTQIDATTVEIILPSVAGSVTAVSGRTISITSFGGKAVTVTTDSSTLFRDRTGKTTIASVTKGDFVEAFGTVGAGNSFAAATVDVGPAASAGPNLPGGFGAAGSFGPGGFGGPGGPAGRGGFARSGGWGTASNGPAGGAPAPGGASTL